MKTYIDIEKKQIISQAENEKEFAFMKAGIELFADESLIEVRL